jgi:hypothetical protein
MTEQQMVSKAETIKDTIQVAVESGATHVGKIVTIITTAIKDIAHEVGEFGTDIFEMQENAKRAQEAEHAEQDDANVDETKDT